MLQNIPTNIFGFVIVLGILVFAHETAHFLAARAFGVRVLTYSFGFGKRIAGFVRNGTDYRISLLPLGGYVRLAGDMTDEEPAGGSDEVTSKPRWQRFLILAAGPVANVILAIVFMMWFLMMGTQQLRDDEPRIGSVVEGRPAAEAGLQPGDLVTAVDRRPIETWEDLRIAIGINSETPIEVEYLREGEALRTTVTPERVLTELGSAGQIGIRPWFPAEIGEVLAGSAADRAGLREGDVIVRAGDREVVQLLDFEVAMEEGAATGIAMSVRRGTNTLELTLPPRSGEEEIWPGFAQPYVTHTPGFREAFDESLDRNWRMTVVIFVTLKRLVVQPSVQDFSGPIEIARISGQMFRAGVQPMIYLLAVISLNLAILNLVPVPVLDGGQMAILVVEGVMRRDISIRARTVIQYAGFFLIVALMAAIILNDVIRSFRLMAG